MSTVPGHDRGLVVSELTSSDSGVSAGYSLYIYLSLARSLARSLSLSLSASASCKASNILLVMELGPIFFQNLVECPK